MTCTSSFLRRRWLGGHRRGCYDARSRGDPRRFAATLAAFWDAALGITLNGTDVSAIASQVPGGVDLTQGTAANQPLYIGAPTYNGQPSIQFTAATTDRLFKSNTDLIGANPCTILYVGRARGTATGVFLGNSAAAGSELGQITTNRAFFEVGAVNLQDGAISTTAPEILIGVNANPAMTLYANGVSVATSSAARIDPGGAAFVTIAARAGATNPSDIDFLLGGIFTNAIDQGTVVRMSHGLGARFGIAA